MFGVFWYRAKVLRVLRDDLKYDPAVPGWQSDSFIQCTKVIKASGGNEYDAASAFMLSALASMPGVDVHAKNFRYDKLQLILGISSRAPMVPQLIANYHHALAELRDNP